MPTLLITIDTESNKDDIMRDLLLDCLDKSGLDAPITETTSDPDSHEYIFSLSFTSSMDTIIFIDRLLFQVEAPDEGFEGIEKHTFSIYSNGKDKKVSSYLTTRLHRSLQYDIQLLDTVVSTIAEDTEVLLSSDAHTTKRLEAVEEYLKSSGIIYYQQFMNELVDVLDGAGLVDKESVKSKMFNTIH